MSISNLFPIKNRFQEGLNEAKSFPEAIILDVRTPQEYNSGHVPGSINLPLNRIHEVNISKDIPLYVHCLSGARSKQACSYLKARGYRAKNIGGISNYKGPLVKEL
ncbi:MAG: rhodanese-like domain-containing protein [Bacillota bacterium]|nr:rhodanese-like domain-containing protein [Bacillota bacterium]